MTNHLLIASQKKPLNVDNTAYSQVVMQDSPYAYFHLNETSGTTAYDISGNNRNGTYNGSYVLASKPILASSALTKYVNLQGPAQADTTYVDISSSSAFGTSGSWSFECWFSLTSLEGDALTDSNSVTFLSNTTGIPTSGLNIFFTGSLYGYWPSSYRDAYWNGTLTLNTNYHLVVTFNSGVCIYYINGQALAFDYAYTGTRATTTADSGIVNYTNNNDLYIGNEGVLGGSFNGYIGEVALYSTVLSQTRVTTHYQAGI